MRWFEALHRWVHRTIARWIGPLAAVRFLMWSTGCRWAVWRRRPGRWCALTLRQLEALPIVPEAVVREGGHADGPVLLTREAAVRACLAADRLWPTAYRVARYDPRAGPEVVKLGGLDAFDPRPALSEAR